MMLRGLKEELAAGMKRLRQNIDLRDLLVFGGIAAAAYGINIISPPAAWIFCGLMMFWLGIR